MKGLFKNDNDEWKDRRAAPLTNNPILRTIETNSLSLQREEEHTRIFASLVPDEVIYHIHDYSRRNFDACLLFGDVSGMTFASQKTLQIIIVNQVLLICAKNIIKLEKGDHPN